MTVASSLPSGTPTGAAAPANVEPNTEIATAALAAGGLVGGFAAARYTQNRPLGGVVLAALGASCAYSWNRTAGPGRAAALTGVYVAAFGGSHPLAKKVGAWPSVLLVSAGTAAASLVLGRER